MQSSYRDIMGIGNKTVFGDEARDVLAGRPLLGARLDAFIQAVAQAGADQASELFEAARRIRLETLGRGVGLCAIVNAKSGRCSENCSFCAQSGHFSTRAPVHEFLEVAEVVRAAEAMRAKGATRFGIVTSGLRPGADDFQRLKECLRAVSALGMRADTSCGVLTRAELEELKQAGLAAYHHNLETARSFFPSVCTTHDYEQDVQAVRDAIAAGLYVCSGGIFGLGESWAQRAELAVTLRELGVPSVPVNFLTPIPGTPMGGRQPMSALEALKTVALLRFLLPDAQLRICGGRDAVFGAADGLAPLEAGASGLMIGDYLTTKGVQVDEDVRSLRARGWEPGRD